MPIPYLASVNLFLPKPLFVTVPASVDVIVPVFLPMLRPGALD